MIQATSGPKSGNTMKGWLRMLTPAIVVTAYYLLKYRAKVSPKAEVDLSNNLQLGRGTVISSFCKIKAFGGPITAGKRFGLASGCYISTGEGGVSIGENVICGPGVKIMASNYNYHQKGVHLEDLGTSSKGIKIGNNVWLGAGAVVTDGAEIGDNTIVVANSLVNRKFDGAEILQGAPAKSIMRR